MLREARHAGASRPGQTGTMAGIVVVDDPNDPRLADYARLTDVRLRSSMEPARGLFVAEGDKVIRRALDAGDPGQAGRPRGRGRRLSWPGLRDLPGGRRTAHRLPGTPRCAGLDGPPCAA